MARFHKVKSQKWANGQLQTNWDFFDLFEDAKIFAENLGNDLSAKVYTDTDELLHSVAPTVTNTYA
jgi:phenylalanyl-tRNA synthetase beta subunit